MRERRRGARYPGRGRFSRRMQASFPRVAVVDQFASAVFSRR